MKKIEFPIVVYLEAVLMANGEVIHYGKTLGWANDRQMDLVKRGATKLTKDGEDIVAVGEEVA